MITTQPAVTPRKLLPLLLALGALPLGGCVAGMAMSAASMAARAAQGTPQSNAKFSGSAAEQCSARAAAYGTVHIIDVEQHSTAKIIVWGTVDDGKQRQSFQCDYGTKITGFKLRPVAPTR
jgi:hypothetical protein